jgi:hypothetical protein
LIRSSALIPNFEDGLKEYDFLRQTQDTEFIEVQGNPLPIGRQAEPLGLSGSTELLD